MKKENGITLLSVVVTIIILLILASVTISLIVGDNGIVSKVKLAEEEYRGASVKEEIDSWKADTHLKSVMNGYGKSLEEVLNDLQARGLLYDNEIEAIKNSSSKEIEIGSFKLNFRIPAKIRSDGTWDGKVNSPKLVSGMQAIYWDDSGNEIKQDDENFDAGNWYDYDKRQWANAITNDGNYWVWIPRFAYKITEQPLDKSESGKIEVVFLNNNNENDGKKYSTIYPEIDSNRNMQDYYVHPAFGTDLELGGWSENISGFWMAKYAIGREDSSDGGITWESIDTNDGSWRDVNAIGNVLIEKNKVKLSSKPGLNLWVGATVGTAFQNAYKYDRVKESHLQKNSEWGAMAYLTFSSYGRGRQHPELNLTEYLSGGGTEDAYKSNTNQSTTGNITGLYDTAGGEQLVAVYNSEIELEPILEECISRDGEIFVQNSPASTKYVTVYTNGHYESWGVALDVGKYGDGLKETWITDEFHWGAQEGWLVAEGLPFLSRGYDGIFGSVGQFGFTSFYMQYRVCLTPK